MTKPMILNSWLGEESNLESLLDRIETPAASFNRIEGEVKDVIGHVIAITESDRTRLVQLLKIALSKDS